MDELRLIEVEPWRDLFDQSSLIAWMLTPKDPLVKATDYKLRALEIAKLFGSGRELKYQDSLRQCGTWLHFDSCPTGHEKKLRQANFCGKRLCPICQWRRTVRMAQELWECLHAYFDDNPKDRLILVTLTVPNVKAKDLGYTVTHLFESYQRLIKRKEVNKICKGFYRTLEVTYNDARDDYHPHIHALFCVPSNYFTENYIKQDRWLELWQESTRDKSITQIDVRAVNRGATENGLNGNKNGVFREVSKYAVKTSDFLKDTVDDDKKIEVLLTYAFALHKRKLQAFGRDLLDYRKRLHLEKKNPQDEEKTDLTDYSDCACSICNSKYVHEIFNWQKNVYFCTAVNEDPWIQRQIGHAKIELFKQKIRDHTKQRPFREKAS